MWRDNGKGNVLLSTKRLQTKKLREEFEENVKAERPITVKVTGVVNGGITAEVAGIKVFIPQSQLGRKVTDLNEYRGKTIDVKIMLSIPYCGDEAVGAHTLLNKISVNPTLKIAGVPEINIYPVIEITAMIETTAQQVKITEADFSTIDFVFLFAIIELIPFKSHSFNQFLNGSFWKRSNTICMMIPFNPFKHLSHMIFCTSCPVF